MNSLTKDQAEKIQNELQENFPYLQVNVKEDARPNYTTREFEYSYVVNVWMKDVVLDVFTEQKRYDAFKIFLFAVQHMKRMSVSGEVLEEWGIDPNFDPTYASRMLMSESE